MVADFVVIMTGNAIVARLEWLRFAVDSSTQLRHYLPLSRCPDILMSWVARSACAAVYTAGGNARAPSGEARTSSESPAYTLERLQPRDEQQLIVKRA